RRHLSAGEFGNEQCCSFQCQYRHVGIGTALETERRIGFESVPLSCFANRHRMEVGTLQEYPGRIFRYPRVHASENARDTQGLLRVTDHQVLGMQLTCYPVERNERFTGLGLANNHTVASQPVGIEGMQWL